MVSRIRRAAILASAGLLVALAGCTGTDVPDGTEPPDGAPAPEEIAPPGQDPPSGEADPPDEAQELPGDEGSPGESTPATEHDDERVLAAAEDLAERTGNEPEQVQVVAFRGVTWRDGSIGCPEEGMAYTQALVDGYLLVLEAGGTHYRYHAAGDEEFAYCENPQEPLNGDGGGHR